MDLHFFLFPIFVGRVKFCVQCFIFWWENSHKANFIYATTQHENNSSSVIQYMEKGRRWIMWEYIVLITYLGQLSSFIWSLSIRCCNSTLCLGVFWDEEWERARRPLEWGGLRFSYILPLSFFCCSLLWPQATPLTREISTNTSPTRCGA